MRLVILGLIGAGKGTQAKRLAAARGIVHIATGDMFRAAAAAGTELGQRAQGQMERGELVPDEVTIDMLLERIAEPDTGAGFILDGFPRTVAQAEALETALRGEGLAIDAVPRIEVAEELLLARIATRPEPVPCPSLPCMRRVCVSAIPVVSMHRARGGCRRQAAPS